MYTQGYNEADDRQTAMNTITAIVNKVVKKGYTDSFSVKNMRLYSPVKNRYYEPDQICVINFYRFEGDSDPGDESILYVIEAADGQKGTLLDAYGHYGDEKLNAFMKQVENMNKKVDKH
jgi:hypothetical protein